MCELLKKVLKQGWDESRMGTGAETGILGKSETGTRRGKFIMSGFTQLAMQLIYHIVSYFQGGKFSRIGLFQLFIGKFS